MAANFFSSRGILLCGPVNLLLAENNNPNAGIILGLTAGLTATFWGYHFRPPQRTYYIVHESDHVCSTARPGNVTRGSSNFSRSRAGQL